MAQVAFLGTGLLGAGMSERMLAQGDHLTVWNRTSSKARALEPLGAKVAATAAAAVAGAEFVHCALTDDAVVDAVLAEVLPHLPPAAVVVDHSTSSPHLTKGRVARLADRQVAFVHAPVFMSPNMCRDGKGLIMVAGPRSVFERAQAKLERMTGEVWYVGERGDLAAAYKLFGNSMIFVINAGLSDVLAMAKNLGIAGEEAIGLFSKFNAGVAIPMRGLKMAKGDFSAMFELAMARKDLRLMLEAAGPQPLVALPALAKRMDEAIADGHGKDDLVALAAPVVNN